MATQVKDRPAGKNDSFIEAQLARTQSRIRFVDLMTAVLGFVAGTLAFAVLMILLDRRWVLSAGVRQGAFVAYLAGAGVYLLLTVVRPLRWRVNRHFAARRLEETLPGSRNHVINWIDLHEEKVPTVLKSTLGQRAAKDLAKADVDSAISTRRAVTVGGTAGLFAGLFILLFFVFGPRPFGSLFGRLFAPFGGGGNERIASRTEVIIVRPRDATVTIGNAVTIVAQVSGRVPDARDSDAPCLYYRHDESEPYRKRYLQADDSNQEWSTTISPIEVGNGFYYKVTAGDAETNEYHVSVRAAPLISEFQATYHYRPYTRKASQTRTSRKLEDLRGTEVEIKALTNRVIKDGRLEFEGEDGGGDLIRSEHINSDPQRLRFRMVLDRPGKYRIRFTTPEGEAYIDSTAHEVAVFPDLPPQIRLIEPGKDVVLPANGRLELKGEASDDFGIASLTLHLQLVGGVRLESRPYLPDKLGKPNYGTPRQLEYRDLIELSALKMHDGKPAELKPGMEIEYWLEAADACDYPRPNVTSSQPRFKITIADADEDEARQQKEREAAEKRKKENEKKQAEQMQKEQQARDEQKRKEEAAEKQKAGEKEKQDKGKEEGKNKPDGEKKPGEKSQPKEGTNADEKKDKDTQKKAEELKNRLEQKEQKPSDKSEQEKRGEAKGAGEDNKPGQGKDKGEKKPGQGEEKENKPGEQKSEGGQDGKNPAGQKKDGGSKAGEQGSARGENRPDKGEQKGETKKAGDKGGDARSQPGQGKASPAPKSSPGQAKEQGKGEPAKNAGERKEEGKVKPGERTQQGEAREKGPADKPNDVKPGESKEGAKPQPQADGPKGECKECKGNGGSGKSGGGAKGNQGAGKDKPGGTSGEGSEKRGEKKDGGEGKNGQRPENAKPSDVEDLARKLQDRDNQTRGDAKRDLEEIADRARDQKSREAAKEALEKDRQANQPGQNKPGGAGPGQEKGEKKEGEGKKGQGEAKGGDPKDPADKGSSKGPGAGKQGDGPEKQGERPGKGKDRGDGKGETPGAGMKGEREPGTGTGGDSEPMSTREKPEAHRASMMQLEEFRKKVDRDILKDMKMTREDFEKFLKDYAELAKRQQKAEPETPETIAPPRAGGTLPTIASGPRKTTGSGKPGDLKNDGRAQPPPEYRDRNTDFVRRLGTQKK
jgi:hypothetical protein